MPRALRPLALLALQLGVAAAAHAGAVYVPLPGVTTVGSTSWEATVSVVDPTTQAAPIKGYLIPGDSDGTQRATPATPTSIDAGKTFVYKPDAAFRGLLELSGSPLVTYAARLDGHGGAGTLGVALPVVTSANTHVGGGLVELQGLGASATRSAAVGVVNMAPYPATCQVAAARADGSAIGTTRTLTLLPLTQTWLADAFDGAADAAGMSDARVAVSCNQTFFAWALLADSSDGELSVVEPAASGASLLLVPGEQAPCPAGATCQSSSLVFSPDPTNPVGHVIFPAPAGVFHRLRLEMEVTVGQFYPQNPDGKHLIYWFVINKNVDMPGMLYFRGPDAYTALVRYGIGLKHPQKLKIVDPNFRAVPGRTYHVVNDFDMGAGQYTVTITDVAAGQVVSTLHGVPNVGQVTLKTGDRFLVDMGFPPGGDPDEVPSFNGWVYSKVRVDAIP